LEASHRLSIGRIRRLILALLFDHIASVYNWCGNAVAVAVVEAVQNLVGVSLMVQLNPWSVSDGYSQEKRTIKSSQFEVSPQAIQDLGALHFTCA